jgi:hypothetical protein
MNHPLTYFFFLKAKKDKNVIKKNKAHSGIPKQQTFLGSNNDITPLVVTAEKTNPSGSKHT